MNRGRLYATIEHLERGIERPKRPGAAEDYSPPSTPRERAERLNQPWPRGSGASALATATKRAKPDPKGAVRLTGKALKLTLVLDAAELGQIELPQGKPAPPLIVVVDGRKVTARIPAKNLRKALALIAEHGADRVAVSLRGSLPTGTQIADAGLVTQLKAHKPR